MAEEIVLLVDDDRTTGRLCQRLLERASYRVIATSDPLDGLHILEHQRVDLLLADIRMPVMDGFELISRARHFQPDLPVLLMTGYGSIDVATQALHWGVNGLILKPFEKPAELVQTVRRILSESWQKRDAVRAQSLRPLFDVTEDLITETSPRTLEKLVIETVTGLFHASFTCIYRFDSVDGQLITVKILEDAPTSACAAREEMLCQLSSCVGVPVVANTRGLGSSSTVQFQPMLESAGLETLMIAPVQRTNKYVFCAGREAGSAVYTEADLEMFAILARQAAVAIENAYLVSELRNYVLQIEESNRALIQAEKMAAVGRLVASLAHEINNPLQAVRNCLHLAGRAGLNEEQRSQYLQMTDNELDRLVNMVREMLDFYRPVNAETERVDMGRLVEQVLALIKPQLQDLGIRVHVHRPEVIPPVTGASSQLKQVIFNLMINAIDAMADANDAILPMRNKEIWVDILADSRYVSVIIEDSGPGIPDRLREQIFEPFVSTKKNGTGLGLTISFGILESHQGRLVLAPSRHGSGACFEIRLPVEVEKNDQSINCR